jgi:RimJ/RimL family protein N-acetyltransferase
VAGDLDDCAAMWSDPTVILHFGGKPFTREEVWFRILRYGGLWALVGHGYWAMRETATGRFVGELGLADFQRAMSPGFDGAPEIGWTLASWAHRQGFASEAVACVLTWADATLNHPRTACMIVPENQPSLRLAGRFGYAAYARSRYRDKDVILLERARGGTTV